MGWMIGMNGQTTMPKCRLDLGHKPSYNINYKEKTYNNGGMPFFDPQYGTGWSTQALPYQSYNYNNGMNTTMGIMAGIGLLVGGLGEIFGNSKKTVTPEQTETQGGFEQVQKQTNEQLAEMNKKLQAAVAENQKLKAASQEYQQVQNPDDSEIEALKKEGITKNADGSYTGTTKGIFGNEVTVKGLSADEVRAKMALRQSLPVNDSGDFYVNITDKSGNKTEISGKNTEEIMKKIIDAKGIKTEADGTYSLEITKPDGSKETQKASSIGELLNLGNPHWEIS